MPTLAQAIKYANFAGRAITVENVNRYLNSGQKITQEQLDAHHASAGAAVAMPEPASAPEAETEPWLAEPAPATVAERAEPEAEVIPLEPVLSVAVAQRRLVESQVRLRSAFDRQRECRGRVGIALARWQQAIGVVITPEQNARAFIASELARRQGERDGTIPVRRSHRAHRSVVDATAAAFNQGNGRNGGGNAFRRVVKTDSGEWVRPVDGHSRMPR